MKDLYKLTITEAISFAVKEVMENHPELSKKDATDLVKNALVYNCVIEEIVNQTEFLLEEGVD